jgi:hypothetical protein
MRRKKIGNALAIGMQIANCTAASKLNRGGRRRGEQLTDKDHEQGREKQRERAQGRNEQQNRRDPVIYSKTPRDSWEAAQEESNKWQI